MLAIIPARGGSKGLPRKNIKKLNDKPLIAYTIESALKSKYISKVIVSTDNQEIAEIAIKYGAECPFMRPKELASDTSKSIDVMLFTIEKLIEVNELELFNFIILQPTSPFRNENHIDQAVEIFINNNAESVISYTQEDHPVFWNKYITNKNQFEEIFKFEESKNRQEYRPTYRPNGAIYILNYKMIKQNYNYYSEKSYAYIMNKKDSIDIDTAEDFEYAEFLMSKK